jgi:hypothetical protein
LDNGGQLIANGLRCTKDSEVCKRDSVVNSPGILRILESKND